MKKIVVLHSYRLTDEVPVLDLVRIRYFFYGLEREGYVKDKDYSVKIIDSNDLDEIESGLLQETEKGNTDLIHAVGTPNAAIAAKFTKDIPIVYYGAHPQDSGKKECRQENMCGLVLTLPFTSSYKKFRFTRKLFPHLKNIYVPYYEGTIFCHDDLKEKHNIFRNKNNGPGWVEMNSEYIGYSSLSGLCYIIGLNYFEHVYKDVDELRTALELIDPKETMLMPYNDTVYCKGAPEALIAASNRKKIPLLWNNNPQATRIGAVAAVVSCFKEAGSITGSMAGRVLNGVKPSDIGFPVAKNSYASINLTNARNMGLEFSAEVLKYFNEIRT